LPEPSYYSDATDAAAAAAADDDDDDVSRLLLMLKVVKNEVNVPVLKNFVEQLYVTTLDTAMKRKHCLVSVFIHYNMSNISRGILSTFTTTCVIYLGVFCLHSLQCVIYLGVFCLRSLQDV